jgi:hypothetical protein
MRSCIFHRLNLWALPRLKLAPMGLVPAIHVLLVEALQKSRRCRDERGHDAEGLISISSERAA